MKGCYDHLQVCIRSSAKGHCLTAPTKFHRDCLGGGRGVVPWKSAVILLHISTLRYFFHIPLETSKNGHGNGNICVLITKRCSGKFACALLGTQKAWRHRNGITGRNTACVQTDRLLPKDGISVQTGGEVLDLCYLLIPWFLVQEDLQN